MMRKIITAILILVTLFYGCEKDESPSGPVAPATPAATTSFSAKVNGNTVQADTIIASLHVDTSLGIPLRTFILFAVCDTHIIAPGFFDLINSTVVNFLSYDSVNASGGVSILQYRSMNDTINDYMQLNSHLDISAADTINRKISGHFSGTLVGDVSGDTIIITDGVFSNIHYEVW